jgi:hypothetical protein
MKQDLAIMLITLVLSAFFYIANIPVLFFIGVFIAILLSIVYGHSYKGQKSAFHAVIPVLLFVGWMVTTVIDGTLCTLVMFAMFGSFLYYAYFTDMRTDKEPVAPSGTMENKKYCPACGQMMDVSAVFCSGCGKEQ